MTDHPFTIHTVPCLSDNYAFILHNHTTNQATVVDVPEAGPIAAKLRDIGATLSSVFLTHHHWDHVDGLDALRQDMGTVVPVIGAKADEHRLPNLTEAVVEGDTVDLAGFPFTIFDVSGHTIGHIAAYGETAKAVFTADSLMAMGCGRLFEGTPVQMWDSMQKLRALPDDTVVYSGHEYMGGNMAFALSLGEENPALAARADAVKGLRLGGRPTVPSLLGVEKTTNPFLRADDPSLQAAIGMVGADAADVFAEVRKRKDNF